MTCTFFGHRECPEYVKPILQAKIIDLIENKGVNKFYVGNHGEFDIMVYNVLKEISKEYDIQYNVVLAYMPNKEHNLEYTIFPEGIEKVPPRFAINWRNTWMIKNSDYVITYVRYSFGGAAKFKELAIKQNKFVIDIYTRWD